MPDRIVPCPSFVPVDLRPKCLLMWSGAALFPLALLAAYLRTR